MPSSRIQPGLLRKMTVRQILESLQEHGPLSRADLTRNTGISAPTISKAVSNLMDTGLLEEGEAPDNALGRPGKKLRLATSSAHVVGVVLDPVTCQVVSASLDGSIHQDSQITFSTPASYESLLDRLVESIRDITSRNESRSLGVGLSTPGLIDGNTAECLFSPNMQAINHRRPSADIEEQTGLTTVCLQENSALCLGERLYGSVRGRDNFAMLDGTTGLGLGVFLNGELLRGSNGLAGELGHITVDPTGRLCGCGNHGCLETLATDTALAAAISARVGRTIRIDEVIDSVREGKLQAADELNHTCEYLSIAMAATINLFNPETLFVHSRFLSISESTLEQVIRMTKRRCLTPSLERCNIEIASTTKTTGSIAAIVHHLMRSAGPRVED